MQTHMQASRHDYSLNAGYTALWLTVHLWYGSSGYLAGRARPRSSLQAAVPDIMSALLLLQVVIVVEGTRGIDFLFGIIIAVVCANWVAQFIHKDGVYESELDHDGNVFFLRTEAPHALQYKTAGEVGLNDNVEVLHLLFSACLVECLGSGSHYR